MEAHIERVCRVGGSETGSCKTPLRSSHISWFRLKLKTRACILNRSRQRQGCRLVPHQSKKFHRFPHSGTAGKSPGPDLRRDLLRHVVNAPIQPGMQRSWLYRRDIFTAFQEMLCSTNCHARSQLAPPHRRNPVDGDTGLLVALTLAFRSRYVRS